jgi:hypothetical protein
MLLGLNSIEVKYNLGTFYKHNCIIIKKENIMKKDILNIKNRIQGFT